VQGRFANEKRCFQAVGAILFSSEGAVVPVRNLSPIQSRSRSNALVNVLYRRAVQPRDLVVPGRLHLAVYSGDTGCIRHARARRAKRFGDTAMKVTVTIDCTPLEAREFFGLPDVQPMQAAMMEQVQAKVMANLDQFSPETLLQNWFTFDPKMAERMGDMFVNMAGLGGSRSKDK
jgi:Family of unknown function (DUF6489)